MKKYIIILAATIGFSGSTLIAQDVTLTNAKLEKPAENVEYGNACFTIIAEDGLAVTTTPLAVEISLSKVDFDAEGINGFNSELFNWEVDAFAPNVVKGTLITDIPSVDENGGGAQICIPVKRNEKQDYDDVRNGFLVNVVPGSVDQGGNSGADAASRFGFSQGSIANRKYNGNENESDNSNDLQFEKLKSESVSIFPNPASKVFTFTSSDNGLFSLSVFDAQGNKVKNVAGVESGNNINIQDLIPGIYHIVISGTENQEQISKRLIIL